MTSPEVDTALRFTSYTYDPVIGKYFAGQRFYDSTQGRMLSPDPIKRGLNPYTYCDNDPVNYNDPTGEIPSIIAGGLLGFFFGGASGFVGSTLSQVTDGEKFSWRKAWGAAANGAVVGAAKGALVGSGVGIPAAFATDFVAGASGNALEQFITKGRVNAGESLQSNVTNAVSERLYGTGEIAGFKDALIRGAKAGGAVSGINNIAEALGLRGAEVPVSAGRDPRSLCGSPYSFVLAESLENGRGLESGGFSLGGFLKDTLTGAIVGGLGSAGFYGAGKAVDALRESFAGRRQGYGKSSGNYSGADNIADAARLKEYYKQAEKYGTGSIKELQNGRFRSYKELKPARTQGEMAGARHVREWDPYTGYKRDWYETLDHNGTIRQVRPDPNITGGVKVHYMFDADGNYIGKWIPISKGGCG